MSYVQQKRQRHHQQLQCIWLACITVCTHEGINFSFSVYTRGPGEESPLWCVHDRLVARTIPSFFFFLVNYTQEDKHNLRVQSPGPATSTQTSLKAWEKSQRLTFLFFWQKLVVHTKWHVISCMATLKLKGMLTESVLTCRRCPRNI